MRDLTAHKETQMKRTPDIKEIVLDPRIRNLGSLGVALVAAAKSSSDTSPSYPKKESK